MGYVVFNITPWTLRVLPSLSDRRKSQARDVPPNSSVEVVGGDDEVVTITCGNSEKDRPTDDFFCVRPGKMLTLVHEKNRLEISALQ